MANKVVIFPVGKEAQADAYRAWTNARFAERAPGEGGFGYAETILDMYGQRVEAFYGPPFEYPVGTLVEEPAGGAAMRADGVLHDRPVMPVEE
jgi:hypothetical protein